MYNCNCIFRHVTYLQVTATCSEQDIKDEQDCDTAVPNYTDYKCDALGLKPYPKGDNHIITYAVDDVYILGMICETFLMYLILYKISFQQRVSFRETAVKLF